MLVLVMGLWPVPCVSGGVLRPQLHRLEGRWQVHHNSPIKTGTYCSYTPDVRLPITWQV